MLHKRNSNRYGYTNLGLCQISQKTPIVLTTLRRLFLSILHVQESNTVSVFCYKCFKLTIKIQIFLILINQR